MNVKRKIDSFLFDNDYFDTKLKITKHEIKQYLFYDDIFVQTQSKKLTML